MKRLALICCALTSGCPADVRVENPHVQSLAVTTPIQAECQTPSPGGLIATWADNVVDGAVVERVRLRFTTSLESDVVVDATFGITSASPPRSVTAAAIVSPAGATIDVPLREILSGVGVGDVATLHVVARGRTATGDEVVMEQPLSRSMLVLGAEAAASFSSRSAALSAAFPALAAADPDWDGYAYAEKVSDSDAFIPTGSVDRNAREEEH